MAEAGLKLWLAILSLGFLFVACGSETPPVQLPATVQPSPTDSRSQETSVPPIPTASPLPTLPSPTPVVQATPTPLASLIQLTQGKCCAQPFWASDSHRVLFIDKPEATGPTGIYGVDIDNPGAIKLVTTLVAYYTSDLKYATFFDGAFTIVENLDDGEKWRLGTGGRGVLLSPDRTRVVWNETPETLPFENRLTNVMIGSLSRSPGADQSGGDARTLVRSLRGGATAWLDDQHLLMTGRESPDSQEVTLFTFSLADGTRQDLDRARNLRSITPSPDGKWIAYAIVFDEQPERDGLWLVRRDSGSEASGTGAPRKLGFFGGFQWRDARRLVYVPLEPGAQGQVLYEYDVAVDRARQLTDPTRTPFKIANGDWAISPDGNKIVFVNAQDMNLWLINIP
jgi:hypothetical protein